MKRLIPLLLTALLLTSCVITHPAPDAPETITSSPPPKPETIVDTLPPGTVIAPEVDYDALAAKNLASLPDADMNEAGFLILTTDQSAITPTLSEDEEGGRRIDTALLTRNNLVANKYNVRILSIAQSKETMIEAITSAVASGLYLADLIEMPYLLFGALADAEASVNLAALPFTDYTAPYFDREAIDQCSAGYFTYAVSGNANTHADRSLCLYFNADLLAVKDTELYTLARGGTWTWERLLSLIDAATPAISLSEQISAPELVLATAGHSLLKTAYGVLPEADSDRSVVQRTAELTARILPTLIRENAAEGAARFASGELAFFIDEIGNHRAFANLSFSWGILPLPKADQAQENYTTLGTYQTFFTAIETMTAPERTGMILQALNAASVGQTVWALEEEVLLESARRADTANMIPLFAGHHRYDFGYMIQSHYASVRRASVESFEGAIAGIDTFDALYRAQESELHRLNVKNFVWD